MAAALFLSPFVRATNANGAVLSGAKLHFYLSGTLTPTPTYTTPARTTAHANPVVADAGGMFPDIYLNPAVTYRVILKTAAGVTVEDIDPYDSSVSASAGTIGLFTAAATETIPSPVDRVQTSGHRVLGKGSAWYVYDAAVNSAYVALHPGWSFLSADGRGFRLLEEQNITFEMFGAYGDWVISVGGTDDYPQWLVAKDYLDTVKRTIVNAYYKSVPRINFSRAAYYFSASIDLTDGIYQLFGYGPTSHDYGANTMFVFASGISGILVQSWDTSGVTGTVANTPKGGSGTIVQDIMVLSQGGTIGAEQHGFVMRGTATFIRCYAENFGGNGFKISADTGAANGNANIWKMHDCIARRNGRAGLFIDGGDANAGLNTGFNGSGNGTYGIYDSSFLGNQHLGFHLDGNGLVGVSGPDWALTRPGGQVHRSGDLYTVIKGQEAGASTNAPSGTATDNTWWGWVATGSANSVYPDWVSGTTYLHGGAVYCDDTNCRSVFNGYTEGNQHGGRINARSLSIGGFQGISGPYINGYDGYVQVNAIFAQQWLTSGFLNTYFGGIDQASGVVMQIDHTTLLSNPWLFSFDGVDLVFENDVNTLFSITGPSTAEEYGTGAALPHMFRVPAIVIGIRRHTSGTAAPASGAHARGEIVWNETPSAGGPMGWMCTAAGTPGTWRDMPNLA